MTFPLLALVLASALVNLRQPRRSSAEQAPPAVTALSDAEIRSRVNTYLGSIDTPISARQWQALGPRAAAVLKETALNPQALPSRRARAISALSIVGGQEEADTVSTLSRSPQEPFVVRLAALRATGKMVPTDRLLPILKPVLEGAKDQRLRRAAAEVLTRKIPEAACPSVVAQSEREDELGKTQLKAALKNCGR
jgi:HEAT repeat protein